MELSRGHLCTSRGTPRAPAVGCGRGEIPLSRTIYSATMGQRRPTPTQGFQCLPVPPREMNPNTPSIPEPLPSGLNDISTSSALSMPAHILTSAWPGDLRALGSSAQNQVCYEQMLRQAFLTSAPLTCQAKYSPLEWGLNCALEDMQQRPWPLPTRRQQHPLPSYENRTCLQMQPDVPCEAKSPLVEKHCPEVCLVSI